MRLKKKDKLRLTKKKRERLTVCKYVRKKKVTGWKEDKSGRKWKYEVALEGGEQGEWRKGRELQCNKGWEWKVGI